MSQDEEILALSQITDVLSGLPDDARVRVLRWACERFGQSTIQPHPVRIGASLVQAPTTGHFMSENMDDVSSAFDKADPSTEPERALVVGYWLQVHMGQTDFNGREVNDQLRQIGHPASNITTAMDGLIRRKPRLAMQTSKTGRGTGARKRYKLTREGIRTVQAMMSPAPEDETDNRGHRGRTAPHD